MSAPQGGFVDAVIVATARTPIGRARKGSLRDVDAFELAQIAVGGVIERSGIPTSDIDDIVLAESLQGGGVIARHTAVALGLTSVPGMADNRHCAAGLTAVSIAAAGIRAGMDDVVVAGGTESLSTSPSSFKRLAPGADPSPWMSPSHPATPDAPAFDMTITVGENTAREMGLTRRDVDEWAAYSHGNAIASIDSGAFVDEIIPVTLTLPDGSTSIFSAAARPPTSSLYFRCCTRRSTASR
jgi:acetyl-CoA acetyltransferase